MATASTTSQKRTNLGTLLCALSAIGYTAYNLFLCDVSPRYDPSWINCVQASVSVVVIGLYLLWLACRGCRTMPGWKELVGLLGVGLITQVGGVFLIWAMSIVGAAVSITLQTGVMLGASAILGLLILGERVSWRQIIAIVLITASIGLFAAGTDSGDAGGSGSAASGLSVRTLLGIAAAGLAGISFAILAIGVRKTVTGDTLPVTIVFLINIMGVIVLGPWSVWYVGYDRLLATPLQDATLWSCCQVGVHQLMETSLRDLSFMLGAGAFNLIAFFLVTKSLQMITVVRLNVMNNGLSTAITAVGSAVLLGEKWNSMCSWGMLLGLIGILIISLESPPSE